MIGALLQGQAQASGVSRNAGGPGRAILVALLFILLRSCCAQLS
jgi:hypothetical protein